MNGRSSPDRDEDSTISSMRGATPTTFSGDQLRSLRERQGLSAAQLGASADVTADVLRNYESGKVRPTWKRTEQLADSLGVAAIDLLNEDAAENQLIWFREQHLLSQKDVATHLEVAVSTVSRWEAAGQIPSKHVARLASLYRVDPDELRNSDAVVDVRLSIAAKAVDAMDEQRGARSRSQYVTQLIDDDGGTSG